SHSIAVGLFRRFHQLGSVRSPDFPNWLRSADFPGWLGVVLPFSQSPGWLWSVDCRWSVSLGFGTLKRHSPDRSIVPGPRGLERWNGTADRSIVPGPRGLERWNGTADRSIVPGPRVWNAGTRRTDIGATSVSPGIRYCCAFADWVCSAKTLVHRAA